VRVAEAGADELCVHARTRTDGYRPPAHWREVSAVRDSLSIPVIVNGEIWNADDYDNARADSQCCDVMLGRGALSVPDLARLLCSRNHGESYSPLPWVEILPHLQRLLQTAQSLPQKNLGNRTKQWLTYLRRGYPEAEVLFERVKRQRSYREISDALAAGYKSAA